MESQLKNALRSILRVLYILVLVFCFTAFPRQREQGHFPMPIPTTPPFNPFPRPQNPHW